MSAIVFPINSPFRSNTSERFGLEEELVKPCIGESQVTINIIGSLSREGFRYKYYYHESVICREFTKKVQLREGDRNVGVWGDPYDRPVDLDTLFP
jgi:hypothetical protein